MDWLSFLNSNGIAYTYDQNRREVSIECPFCNDTDHSQHLGISTGGRGWHCWKDERHHSGRFNARLIVALIGCSYEQAKIISEQNNTGYRFTDGVFGTEISRLLGGTAKPASVQVVTKLKALAGFKPVVTTGLCGMVIVPYLIDRKYGSKNNVVKLADRFRLMYALSGPFSYRVIIPVYMNKEIVNWTGRSVVKGEALRYLSLSDNAEVARKYDLPVAARNIKDCILDYDNLRNGGDTLVICEGPFDAMRISFLGEPYGILGTCLFNALARATQIELLMVLAKRFRKTLLLLDRAGTTRHMISFPHDYFKASFAYLPNHIKDPAELEPLEFQRLFEVK